MFQNLGRTIALLRELKHLSQAAVARRAGIGKSQLSKYEGFRPVRSAGQRKRRLANRAQSR